MASVAFPTVAKKTTLRDGTTYGYVYVPAKPTKATVLLLHGAPSSCYDWRHQIEHLPRAGYGVLAPDLLGYGDTDNPTAIEPYQLKYISSHVDELLTQEGLQDVVGIGHDWGSSLLSYMAVHYQSRFSALAFIAVGFVDPSIGFDIDLVNKITKDTIGFSTSGYVKLFNADHGAALIEAAHASFDSLMYAEDPLAWRWYLGAEGACEAFLNERKILPMGSYISNNELEMHSKIMMRSGYTGMLNWYKALVRIGPSERDKSLTTEEKKLRVPTLMVVTEKDYVVVPEEQAAVTEKWAAADYKSVRMNTAHWVMLEDRDGFEDALEDWLGNL